MGEICSPIQAGAPVFMLSGQGSQKPGMGFDLQAVPEVAETFACASEVFGFDVASCVATAPIEILSQARNATAALSALSIGIARALMARGVQPAAALGFSLGQIGSLAVTGMLSVEETFALARERANLMDQSALAHPGLMCALLGADETAAAALCEECSDGDVLVVANFNCPGQIVISGTKPAIERARERWAAEKKRSVLLATAGAFHSPLMRDASDAFVRYLEFVEFSHPTVPLICNVDARPLLADQARDHLAQHLVSPVQFSQSVKVLQNVGADTFLEVGYGGVLMGFVKRLDRGLVRVNVEDRAGFELACETYAR